MVVACWRRIADASFCGYREGVEDLDALKVKVLAPSIRTAMKTKPPPRPRDEPEARASESTVRNPTKMPPEPQERRKAKAQAQGDRAGVKVG